MACQRAKETPMLPFAMYARCGNSEFRILSWEHVSQAYRATIDALGIGSSQTPPCFIIDASGAAVGRVSYNGKVWLHDLPVYCPIS